MRFLKKTQSLRRLWSDLRGSMQNALTKRCPVLRRTHSFFQKINQTSLTWRAVPLDNTHRTTNQSESVGCPMSYHSEKCAYAPHERAGSHIIVAYSSSFSCMRERTINGCKYNLCRVHWWCVAFVLQSGHRFTHSPAHILVVWAEVCRVYCVRLTLFGPVVSEMMDTYM